MHDLLERRSLRGEWWDSMAAAQTPPGLRVAGSQSEEVSIPLDRRSLRGGAVGQHGGLHRLP